MSQQSSNDRRRHLRLINGGRARSPLLRPVPPPSDEAVGGVNPPEVVAHVQRLIDEITATATEADDP